MTADADHAAFRRTEPDAGGLMDVLELVAPGARVTGWSRLVGGLDAAMHRIEVAMPSGAGTAFVLRRYNPAWHGSADALREAETLERLRPTHVRAPELLWLDADGHAFGVSALAMTLLPGRPEISTGDPARWGRELAEPLGGLHIVPASMVPHLPVDATPAAMLARLRREASGAGAPVRPQAHRWALPADRMHAALDTGVDDLADGELRLVHGDYHGGQVLRDDDEVVTGVVDWLHARVADPRWDLGYAHYDTSLLHGPVAAEAFVERYETITGRAFTDRWWWGLLAATTSLPDPAKWAGAMAESGGDVTPDLVRQRARAYVDRCLSQARGPGR